MVVSSELSAAVETAYRVFHRYKLGGRITVCRCSSCVAPQVEQELIHAPLRDLSALTLAEYTHSGHGWEAGVEDELKHFLPRYFELIAAGEPPSNHGVETSLQRLANVDYRAAWPKAEADAVDGFLLALLRATLATEMSFPGCRIPTSGSDSVEDILCMSAFAGVDLGMMLDAWDKTRSPTADVHIAHMIASADWLNRRLRNSFFRGLGNKRVAAESERVLAWLVREETRARLEAAVLAESDPKKAELLSYAEGIIAGLLARRD